MPSILSKLSKQKYQMTERQLAHKLRFSRHKNGPKVRSLYELRERRNWGMETIISENIDISEAAALPISEIAYDFVQAALEDPTFKLDNELFQAIERYAMYRAETYYPIKKVVPLLEKLYGAKCNMHLCFSQPKHSSRS